MVLAILGVIRVFLLVAICYFIIRLFFLLRNLHNEDRLFVPTVKHTLPLFWKHLQENKKIKKALLGSRIKFDHFIDIGAGDGAVVIKATELAMAREITGAEIQYGLYLWGWLRTLLYKVFAALSGKRSAIHWLHSDVEKLPLSDYDCMYLFLAPSSLQRIQPLIKKQAKPGTVVMSWVFPLESFAPRLVEVLILPGLKSPKKLHIYRL